MTVDCSLRKGGGGGGGGGDCDGGGRGPEQAELHEAMPADESENASADVDVRISNLQDVNDVHVLVKRTLKRVSRERDDARKEASGFRDEVEQLRDEIAVKESQILDLEEQVKEVHACIEAATQAEEEYNRELAGIRAGYAFKAQELEAEFAGKTKGAEQEIIRVITSAEWAVQEQLMITGRESASNAELTRRLQQQSAHMKRAIVGAEKRRSTWEAEVSEAQREEESATAEKHRWQAAAAPEECSRSKQAKQHSGQVTERRQTAAVQKEFSRSQRAEQPSAQVTERRNKERRFVRCCKAPSPSAAVEDSLDAEFMEDQAAAARRDSLEIEFTAALQGVAPTSPELVPAKASPQPESDPEPEPFSRAGLTQMQIAADESAEGANRHLDQDVMNHTQLSPLESTGTVAEKQEHIAILPLGEDKPPLPADDADAAFDMDENVPEKIIQALRRKVAERDAQLEHAGEVVGQYNVAVRVAEMACARLKLVEAKLQVSEAEVTRLRAERERGAVAETVPSEARGDQTEQNIEDLDGDDAADDGQPEPGPGCPAAPVRAPVVRCCLSCGHRNVSDTHGDCACCGIPLSRPCPSCGAEMKNGASMCLACFEIDNAHTAQPRPRDDLALQLWAASTLPSSKRAADT